jgi:hypothetical protein
LAKARFLLSIPIGLHIGMLMLVLTLPRKRISTHTNRLLAVTLRDTLNRISNMISLFW